MRSKFDAQLKELGEKLTLMGAMCEEAIANSAKALLSGDSELAKKLAPLDLEIDRYERDIEALCLRLLLQQQPGTFLYINPHVPVPSAYPKGQSPFQWSRRQ